MKIAKNLNLTFPVDRDSGVIHVHSTPITKETFEQYYMVLAKTLAEIFESGTKFLSGPRIAALLLRDIAISMGRWEGPEGVQQGLLGAIRQRSNVVLPHPHGGWHTVPLQTAIDTNQFSEDELSEVEGVIVYFICVSAVAPRAQVEILLDMTAKTWGAQLTSSNSTEFAHSLLTSIEDENSGVRITSSAPV